MKNTDYIIRLETEKDYREVEEMARDAFWNLSVPGCSEHLFMHDLRKHEAFIPKLDYVAEKDGKIIGCVMYSRSYLIDENGEKKDGADYGAYLCTPRVSAHGHQQETA